MATFYHTFNAEAESASTVKLIRNGKVFADVTDVYTMTWDATNEHYYATLDDATFVEDYYRIEEGAANIVVRDHPVKIKTTADVADLFITNDADDTIIGELSVKPASGTDTQLRIGDETSTVIVAAAENAAGSADRILRVEAGSVDLQNKAAADIKITGLADGTVSGDAVSYDQIAAVQGVGWTTENLVDHESRIANLEGSGTFDGSEAVTLAVTGRGGRGVSLNWYMDSSTNEDAVKRYEVYMHNAALAGHSAGALTAGQLAALRAYSTRVNLGDVRDNSAWIPTYETLYFIIVAFDHDSPETNVASAEANSSPGNPLDSTTPIIGDAASLTGALTTLAGKVNEIENNVGSSAFIQVLAAQRSESATAGAAAGALLEFTNGTTSYVKKLIFTIEKTSNYDTARLRCKLKTDNASYKAYVQIEVDAASNSYETIATGYTEITLDVDISALSNGIYEGAISIKIENAAAVCTMTDYTVYRVGS